MKTETLLYIRPEVQKRIEISAKHALAEAPGIEKTLPQDGNELPAREIAADKNISSHKHSDIHELVNTYELSDIHEQGNTRELSNTRQALLREVSYDLLWGQNTSLNLNY